MPTTHDDQVAAQEKRTGWVTDKSRVENEWTARLLGQPAQDMAYCNFEHAQMEGRVGPDKIPAGITIIHCSRCHTEHYKREDGIILSPISATITTTCTAMNPACKHPFSKDIREEEVHLPPISATSTTTGITVSPYSQRRNPEPIPLELKQLRVEAAKDLGLRNIWELDVPNC